MVVKKGLKRMIFETEGQNEYGVAREMKIKTPPRVHFRSKTHDFDLIYF